MLQGHWLVGRWVYFRNWLLVARYNLAQVSINLTDYEVTGMEMAYEEIKKDATALNLDVCGSEIVSLLYPFFYSCRWVWFLWMLFSKRLIIILRETISLFWKKIKKFAWPSIVWVFMLVLILTLRCILLNIVWNKRTMSLWLLSLSVNLLKCWVPELLLLVCCLLRQGLCRWWFYLCSCLLHGCCLGCHGRLDDLW